MRVRKSPAWRDRGSDMMTPGTGTDYLGETRTPLPERALVGGCTGSVSRVARSRP